ncbi:Ditrans,polycis-undecaprenyl-diphosphate synthase ((2E,6E)-farnesyl-diphosphate specific), partial [Haemophilus influenzae]
KI